MHTTTTTTTTSTSILTAIFQLNLGYWFPLGFFFHLLRKRTFGESGTGFMAGCPSCHPTSSVKALKETLIQTSGLALSFFLLPDFQGKGLPFIRATLC